MDKEPLEPVKAAGEIERHMMSTPFGEKESNSDGGKVAKVEVIV